jgi:IclR family pca regulon transcriptional regulator
MAAEPGSDYVQALARGLAVIRAFGPDRPSMSLSEVAIATRLTRATARRSLLTLSELGYASRNGHRYSLTARVLDLGYGFLSSLRLPELAFPLMEQLAQRVQESCSIAVLDGDDITYVQRVSVRKAHRGELAVGARLPATRPRWARAAGGTWTTRRWTPCSGASSSRRARMDPDRPQGPDRGDPARAPARLRVVEQELEPGLCSVAVPLRTAEGRAAAALNVGMPWRKGIRTEIESRVLPALRDGARAIEQVMRQARIR